MSKSNDTLPEATAIAASTQAYDSETVAQVILHGDLSRLSPEDKSKYYLSVCKALGLEPATKPFEYIRLNGKEVLYAKRDAAEQLRRRNGVSLEIVSRETIDDVYIVTARATMPDGRTDESTGAVSIAGTKGESRANALMKAETKAKRRVTLSICGLGMLDETEVDSVRNIERAQQVRQQAPRSRQLAARIANLPSPTDELANTTGGLEYIQERMLAAKSIAELDDVAPLAAKLPDSDRSAARNTYRARLEELRSEVWGDVEVPTLD